MNRFLRRSALACVVLACSYPGCGPTGSGLPVYFLAQTDSTHEGYRKTTLVSEGTVYLNDFEECSLQLADPEPSRVVGRLKLSTGGVCAIEGQDPADWLAADMGSEMPAYQVFRNERQPPFDWRAMKFQKVRLAVPEGPGANKTTTDPAVIEDILRTLREDAAGEPSSVEGKVGEGSAGVHSILLFSDQLPGLAFAPAVYFDPTGNAHIAERATTQYHGSTYSARAIWIPASPSFTAWSKTAE